MSDDRTLRNAQQNADAPKVSVIIPAYNVAPYIAETLASVLAQTYRSWEAIVVNDGSTDTRELETALGPFRDRITYIVQENKGAGAARNAAMAVASGEWLAFVDGDDYWTPTYLERQLANLQERNLDMVWSDGLVVGDTTIAGRRLTYMGPCSGEVTLDRLILGIINIPNSGTVVRRRCVAAIGSVDESIRRGQDFDLWVRLLNSGVRAGYHSELLLRYRIRTGNLSGDTLSQIEREMNVLRCVRDKQILPDAQTNMIERRITDLAATQAAILGKRQLAARDYTQARASFQRSLRLVPTLKMRIIVRLFPVVAPLLRWASLARTPAEFR